MTIFAQHCVKCHGKDGKVKGKVNLMEIKSVIDLESDPELITSILEVLEFDEMPPEDEPRLKPSEIKLLSSELNVIREKALNKGIGFKHTPIRRMNRFQYNNAVVDLFELKSVVFSLPEKMMREHNNYFKPETEKMPDMVTVGSRPLGKSQLIERRLAGVAPFPQDLRAEHGYDNQADHLSMSPLLMETFLKLGQSVVESHDFNPSNVGIWNSFFKKPSEDNSSDDNKTRLENFLHRAFRSKPDEETVTRYQSFVETKLNEGTSYTEVMKSVAAAVISSPRFLYLYDEFPAQKTSAPISDYELASRLSFFLWGSIPDQTLLNLAATGSLSDRDVISAQFDRMVRDQKLKRFCDSFPTQWLQLERIVSSIPNPKIFPGFYFLKYRDSMHMMLEPLLLFETVLIEDLPITQFIDADFTYRSSLLQHAYKDLALNDFQGKGNNEVTVLRFRRMPVKDRRSGGLITNAAVMTMTSGPERTQPITRGAWLAGVIFNDPPEPPPADVPTLDESPKSEELNLTLRERLSMHREKSDCRGCHEKIDPLGFALENYDPIGNWRSHYSNGRKVDMSGKLFRKYDFSSVVEFKDSLLDEKDRFTRALAEHLLSFALARELGPSDTQAIDLIVEDTIKNDYRMKSLLRSVILSEPFLTKTNPNLNP